MSRNLPVPVSNEKTLAALCHVSSIFFPFLGPAVGIAIGHKRFAFVKCHAISALLDEMFWKAILFIGSVISIMITIARVVNHVNEKGTTVTWNDIWPVILRMGITWVVLMILGLILTVQSIRQAMRAYRGNWPTKGVSGRMAMKLAGNDIANLNANEKSPSAN